MTTIIGIKLSDRLNVSTHLQRILTDYGCYIKTRLGIHNVDNNTCYPSGIILVEVTNDFKAQDLQVQLCEIEGIEIQKMQFH